ncbi:hypothetical protein AA14337_3244 [Acetobacter malorum DSM 14337]|uniref:Uncharacterized protein n=1 Tax=Acetobacter malorum DSM 14337 TaxID=1307910 RepID=A0ABQ0Q0H9_9PROT|nr:hypothetical protein [Acetobacter malorum]KXV09869.1 hypothetical protein AD930_02260 [Acetobacter malorum]GBQ86114.1 hypothetical protein AA14337_3244 [Acetobacter malorum DSM 14337]
MINLTVDDYGSLSIICSSRAHDDVTSLLITQSKIGSPYHLVMLSEDGNRTEVGYLEDGAIDPLDIQRTGNILRVRGKEVLSSHSLKIILDTPK